ncbi:hypothetical protein B9Z19DRAFT_1079687 [Tuber borchii]|uniref:VPS9 domain-containing protein n=1 Tax=Tuber borchii TaxID=42251 RepID=A0A2T6ZXS2_TUBBO|nr:hypothetical protein B9Z19DRAFT_1079687 [Tuber borchii]
MDQMIVPEPSSSPSPSLRSSSPDRPGLRGARSFSRLEPSTSNPLSKLQTELTIPEVPDAPSAASSVSKLEESEDDEAPPLPLPDGFDDLPVELLSLTDRFIDSLSMKIHPTPLAVVQLMELFQQFYVTAFQNVDTHVSHSYLSLASKKPRTSPAASKNPTQMLSISEISQKKKDRRLLEAKRLALEEAVERRITEGVYDRIWRHKSTDDEARDESLRSKMAALNVVGVKLGHLGVELEGAEGDIEDELRPAVEALVGMNNLKFPLGKLLSLKQAHKAIVDWLSTHNSSSSADYILPTLIYTLIISPPTQDFNIISNLFFIQRFRAKKAIDGEAAYCLTNLEAAISFLETVDLATLKVDDADPPKQPNSRSRSRSPVTSRSLTPDIPFTPVGDPLANLSEKLAMAHVAAASAAASAHQSTATRAIGSNPSASSSTTSLQPSALGGAAARRLSYLTPIDIAASAATSAVSTADQGIRGIGNTLESSYKFLFGRIEKRGEELPKTLEDARRLVDSPITGSLEQQQEALQVTAAISGLGMDGGASTGNMKRVESTTSIMSNQSGKKAEEKEQSTGGLRGAAAIPAAVAVDKLETVMNLGTSLGRFAVRGFSRSSTPTTPATNTDSALASMRALGAPSQENAHKGHKRQDSAPVVDLLSTFPDLANSLKSQQAKAAVMSPPPVARFLEVEDPGDLRISEVAELLKDYRRLVEELRVRGAVE